MRRLWWVIIGVSVAVVALIIGASAYYVMTSPEFVAGGYVAVIKLSGTIMYEEVPTFFGGEAITPDLVRDLVDRVKGDPMAKAVVLVINSGGGSASASEEIYQVIRELSEEKVVIAYAPEIMASGGYYIALPADRIIASPHALVGSVGAVSIIVNIEELLHKVGVNVTILKSGEFKDTGTLFREPTEKELKLLNQTINELAEFFWLRVKEERPNVLEEVRSARVYLGEDAVKVGLVDSIGTLDDAIKLAKELAGLPEIAPSVEVSRPKSLLEELLGLEDAGISPQVLNPELLTALSLIQLAGKPLYLWAPGLVQ